MVRGAGKFKTKRGGGRSFSRNMSLDENGVAVGSDHRNYRRKKKEEEDDSEEDEDDEDEEEEEDGSSEEEEGSEEGSGEENAIDNANGKVRFAATTSVATGNNKAELTRAERKELKKKKVQAKQGTSNKEGDGEDEDEDDEEEEGGDDDDLINPNHVKKKLNISDLSAPRELTRREREAKEKKEAQERYWKLHQQGKTEQAKADLARLAKIRKEREEALAKRKAEADAKAKEIEAKKAAQRAGKRI